MDFTNEQEEYCYQRAHKSLDNLSFNINVFLVLLKWIIWFIFDNVLLIFTTVILVFILYLIYKSYLTHDVYIKEFSEIGFEQIPAGSDRALRVSEAQSKRRLGSKIPPPYPNGWFALAESRLVRVGGVFAVDALGQNFCVYRGADSKARVVDAYCPHLGANLGIGGSVCGNCIECPFHKWRFGADGELVSVPGLDAVPKGVSIKTWPTAEADGAIWVWHDAEGRPPLWQQEDDPLLQRYSYRARNEFTVGCHIQEIPENGADVQHLNAVHADSVWFTLGQKYPFLLDFTGSHYWTAEWTRGEGHVSTVKMTHDYKVMKTSLFHIDVQVTQIGPGHVRLFLQTPLGPVLISQSVTPVGPLQQKVVFRVFSPAYNAPLAFIMNRIESYQFERDVTIWNNKRFEGVPAYVRTDKAIRAFRSWYSQFYSEHSLSFKDAHNRGLEW